MYDFEFHNPTKIIFGRGTHHKVGEVLKSDGIKKVLFVYGQSSIKKTGLYDDIVKSLTESSIEFVEHPG
ncbi:MAG: iron-containing alcohol dehydrogenase, partial [Hydrogenothermaceae bacterium]